MMEGLFWTSAALIAYVYVGYPLLLAGWVRLRTRSAEHAGGARSDGALAPGVSIIVAVRNEAHRLRARVQNLLALEYPGERQIIVVSDGSTDSPEQALAAMPPNVEIICRPAQGKAAALNAGVGRARHEIVVFADARQRFAPDALRLLVAPFADPQVGGVTGELVLDTETEIRADDVSPVGQGVGLYWRYEKALRRVESLAGSTLGATGAIYALRRSLWRPLPEDTLLDDVLAPMRAVLEGYRVVFEDRAKAFDHASRDAAAESRRKVRTLAGNVQILWQEPRLLLPWANPVWLQYMSHKVGRLLVPYALVALLISSVALARAWWLYALALVLQVTFYLLAAYGAWLARDSLAPDTATAGALMPAPPVAAPRVRQSRGEA